MMTEDLSGDCLNIPPQWRFLHRPLSTDSKPLTLCSAFILQTGEGVISTCEIWVFLWGGNQDWQRGVPDPPHPPNPKHSRHGSCGAAAWAEHKWELWCDPMPTANPLCTALAVSCASPYTERKSLVLDGDTDLAAPDTANIDQPLCKGALLIYPKSVHHPGK